ncbi:MAG: arginase family protein, partial [Cyclobacteriaceae bacterium]|nr:arginase family protein [Cyclobacteriaceae bacterium]
MLHVLGLPTDINSSFLRGPALAPPRIRLMHTQGSANASAEDGTLISWPGVLTDLGDLTLDSANPEYVHQRIREAARAHLRQGGRLICLGGDHSISFPVIDEHAVVHPGLHVLHFDAHGDLYQDFDGNRYSHASPFARLMETGRIASLTQIGIRTLTAHQREQSARYGVRTVEMKDFHSGTLPSLDGPLYISVDLDVLDPG